MVWALWYCDNSKVSVGPIGLMAVLLVLPQGLTAQKTKENPEIFQARAEAFQ